MTIKNSAAALLGERLMRTRVRPHRQLAIGQEPIGSLTPERQKKNFPDRDVSPVSVGGYADGHVLLRNIQLNGPVQKVPA